MNNFKKFNWIATYLLSCITCGFYGFYMFGYFSAAANSEAQRLGVKKIMGAVPAILLGFITCGIFFFVWIFMYYKQITEIAKAKGISVSPTDSPIVLLLTFLVPFYNFYVMCDTYNRVIAEK